MKQLFMLCFVTVLFINPFSAYAGERPFEKLFDIQIQILKDRGVPSDIIQKLENQKSAVLKKASDIPFKDGHIPFLSVIPSTLLSFEKQMEMVYHGSVRGRSYLNQSRVTSLAQIPKEPYYIFDVEDGTAALGKAPQEAEKQFADSNRSPLTAEEGIALVIQHPEILNDHFIDLLGSRLGDVKVPFLWLYEGEPELYWGWASISVARWGSASCGSRWHFAS